MRVNIPRRRRYPIGRFPRKTMWRQRQVAGVTSSANTTTYTGEQRVVQYHIEVLAPARGRP